MTVMTKTQYRRTREFYNRAGAPLNTDKTAALRMVWGFLKGKAAETIHRIRTIAQSAGEAAAADRHHPSVTARALEFGSAPPISASVNFPRQGDAS